LRDTEATQAPIKDCTIATVTVMDEEARRAVIPAAAFHDLLRHPLGCRMLGHLDVENLAAGVMDHEKDVERPEKDRLDAEEVTGPDRRRMLLEKRAPAGRRSTPVPRATHILGHGPGRDLKAKPR
jgi:hypothetical protein